MDSLLQFLGDFEVYNLGHQLLLIESVPTSGLYTVQWKMLIPANSEGYFNMQGILTPPGIAWNQLLHGGKVFFNEAGGAPGIGTVESTPWPDL